MLNLKSLAVLFKITSCGLFCLLAAGCSQTETTYPVVGVVTLDGKVLCDVTLMFDPVPASSKAFSARGSVDQQGKYTLSTFKKDDGAVPGNYRVILVRNLTFGDVTPETRAELLKRPTIPTKYLNFDSTPLKYEIKAEKNRIDIVLTTDS